MTRTHSNGNEAEVHAVFDFTHYSHRDARQMDIETKRLIRLEARIGDPQAFEDDTAFEAALSEYERQYNHIESYICRVVVDVPRDWLLDEAPAELDWKQAESLGWLRQDKYVQLRDELAEARQPENVSKK